MDKNNKKDQTFSDLFSNISNESQKDNNQISFNSINKQNNEDIEKITLENLFNKSQKLEYKENNIENNKKENNDIKFQGFNFNSEDDNSMKKVVENLEKNNSNDKEERKENTTLQSIFEKENINSDKHDINDNQKTKLEIFTKDDSSKDNNSIPESNIESIFNDNKKNENNAITSEKNIFFNNQETESMEKDNLSTKENNLTKEDFTSDSPIFTEEKDNKEEESKSEATAVNKEDFTSENPFFTEENKNGEELKSEETNVNKKDFISDSPIFTEEKDNKEEESKSEATAVNKEDFISENSFFTEEKNKEEELKPEATTVNKENLVSESPFFTEEKQDEINPFFDNKLNLVENKNYNSNDNLKDKIDTSNIKHYNVKIVNKKEPLIKFILGVLSYAVFIWLLLIGITLLIYVADIKIRAAKGDYSSPTFNAYVVLTGSMLPDIQVYDVVVTKKIDAKDLKEGDIITFASSDTRFLNTIITHRIIKKYYDSETKTYTFQTKGDNNNVADSALVQANNIYGKVILKLPKLGYLQEFLASDGGWIIVILIPCLVVISYDIVKLIKGLKRRKYKNIKVQK